MLIANAYATSLRRTLSSYSKHLPRAVLTELPPCPTVELLSALLWTREGKRWRGGAPWGCTAAASRGARGQAAHFPAPLCNPWPSSLSNTLSYANTSSMPSQLRRTSCDQGETTRQICIPVAEFGVLRIQGTNLFAYFYKLVKLLVHARFLTVSQRTFRKLDLFLRLKSSQSAESLYSLNLSNSSLIPGPHLHPTPQPLRQWIVAVPLATITLTSMGPR